jgi:hypothetical protein
MINHWIKTLNQNANDMRDALTIQRGAGWYLGCWDELQGALYYARRLGNTHMAAHLDAELNHIRTNVPSLVTEVGQ